MQVDPIKPTLKAPGSKRLKLIYDKPLSNVAFNFNLRRYIKRLLLGFFGSLGRLPLDEDARIYLTTKVWPGGSRSMWWGLANVGQISNISINSLISVDIGHSFTCFVIGCHVTPYMRVQYKLDNVAGDMTVPIPGMWNVPDNGRGCGFKLIEEHAFNVGLGHGLARPHIPRLKARAPVHTLHILLSRLTLFLSGLSSTAST